MAKKVRIMTISNFSEDSEQTELSGKQLHSYSGKQFGRDFFSF